LRRYSKALAARCFATSANAQRTLLAERDALLEKMSESGAKLIEEEAQHQAAVSKSTDTIDRLKSSHQRDAAAVKEQLKELSRCQERLATKSLSLRRAQDVHAEHQQQLAQRDLNAVRNAEQIAALQHGQDTLHAMLESEQADLAAVTQEHEDLVVEHAATNTQLAAANAEIVVLQSKAAADAAASDADAADAAAAAVAAAADATAADANAQHLTDINVDLRADVADAQVAAAAAGAATAKVCDQLAECQEHQEHVAATVGAGQLESVLVGRCP